MRENEVKVYTLTQLSLKVTVLHARMHSPFTKKRKANNWVQYYAVTQLGLRKFE